jgi:hypothetical protein
MVWFTVMSEIITMKIEVFYIYIYSCVACEYAWICSLNIIAYYKIIISQLETMRSKESK